ncbi:MAG: hypothetical protein ACE5GU_10925 [Candidatus Scalinduaceae bacterium]
MTRTTEDGNAKWIPSEALEPDRHRSGGEDGYLIASALRLPKSCTADRDFAHGAPFIYRKNL